MNKRNFLILIISVLSFAAKAQLHRGISEAVYAKAGANKAELEKAIAAFKKPADSVKLKAMLFLINNMDFHFSQTYYWADSSNKKVAYDELSYPTFSASLAAFDELKTEHPKLHPVPQKLPDVEYVKADFLISTVNDAFNIWVQPWAKEISFANFCEYILPYRISVEPLQDWRMPYHNRFSFLTSALIGANRSPRNAIKPLVDDINKWFTCTYNFEKRTDPLPRLGAMQLLQRKKGFCEDAADLSVFCLRSQGIASTIDNIPFWATSTGGHFFNVAIDDYGKHIPFDVLFKSDSLYKLPREPAKVLRTTFSKQAGSLAAILNRKDIPPGMLQSPNFIDVTGEYWPVRDVACKLEKNAGKDSIAYACVLNGLVWQPAWWGRIKKSKVVFQDMCRGAVFLPAVFQNGRLIPAGDPVVCAYDTSFTIKADTLHLRSITLKEKEKYLTYKPGITYKLFYWSGSWQLIGSQSAVEGSKQLVFEKVPAGALLLLLPQNSKHKERPFIITTAGDRQYF